MSINDRSQSDEAHVSPGEPERRFRGSMSEDYLLVRQAVPDFDLFQQLVAQAVSNHPGRAGDKPLRVLDLGCGDGVTSATLLAQRADLVLTSLDSEEEMVQRARRNLAPAIESGRCCVVLADALTHLRGLPDGSFDAVASALALHNLTRDYRRLLYREIYRVLSPGGLLAVADKFNRNEAERIERLRRTLEGFFNVYVPLGKLDLLRASVLHEIADEDPARVMWDHDTTQDLTPLGFHPLQLTPASPIATLLTAIKR